VKNRLEKFDAESFPCEFQDLVKCLENLFEESLVHVSHSKNLYDEFLWKEMMPSKEFHNVLTHLFELGGRVQVDVSVGY
jgi:hypothetical protein